MGTPNNYQESLEILLEILLEKLLSTQAMQQTKNPPRAEPGGGLPQTPFLLVGTGAPWCIGVEFQVG